MGAGLDAADKEVEAPHVHVDPQHGAYTCSSVTRLIHAAASCWRLGEQQQEMCHVSGLERRQSYFQDPYLKAEVSHQAEVELNMICKRCCRRRAGQQQCRRRWTQATGNSRHHKSKSILNMKMYT